MRQITIALICGCFKQSNGENKQYSWLTHGQINNNLLQSKTEKADESSSLNPPIYTLYVLVYRGENKVLTGGGTVSKSWSLTCPGRC